MIRHLSIITTLSLSLIFSSSVLAQEKKQPTPNKFPPNPIEIKVSDPLLPRNPKKQPLTEQEKQQLEVALEQLNQDATAKLASGNRLAAFDTWNRELRLRRYLGTINELQALTRVGEIAWRNNERPQVQFITQRLQSIQKPRKSPPVTDLATLQALGEGYQKVRSPKLAIAVYNQILAGVRQQRNQAEEIKTLQTIGTIHMSWFDYPQAAATYEELLGLASAKGIRVDELAYLQQLAYIYDQNKQHQQAINTRSKIAEIYTKENNLLGLPELQIAIGSDYEILAKQNPSVLENAFQNYQQAYITAWEQQQYARSGEALQKLIALYRSQGQIDEALKTSQILLQSEELAGNFYGVMKTYDNIGQMHLQRKEYPQARSAFEQGLKFAQQLQHEEDYFTQKIQQIPTN
jgi:tetratricopeptide (TPR) repeat protein